MKLKIAPLRVDVWDSIYDSLLPNFPYVSIGNSINHAVSHSIWDSVSDIIDEPVTQTIRWGIG